MVLRLNKPDFNSARLYPLHSKLAFPINILELLCWQNLDT
jgi:hypothetical protein